MTRGRPKAESKASTPNQVVAANLKRFREKRRWTQAEAAHRLSAVSAKQWTEATVAHAERSVTGNRVREFTADELVALARAFDVPILCFFTPAPTSLIELPDWKAPTSARGLLEIVLGRLDNLAAWEEQLDEWEFPGSDEVPWPSDHHQRDELKATVREVALVRATHALRSYFPGDLMELAETLERLAELAGAVHRHEVFAELSDDELLGRVREVKGVKEKDRRVTVKMKEADGNG